MALYNPSMQQVGPFLGSQRYSIPDYQREYSWESDAEVSDFWEDLMALVYEREANRNAIHFFGQIVIHNDKEDSCLYLIDGQQRITTSVIMLAVMRDHFAALKDCVPDAEDEYTEIKSNYIGRYKETTGDDKLHFHLGGTDSAFFRDNIQLRAPFQKPSTPAQKRVVKAYNYLFQKIESELKGYKEPSDKYRKLTQIYAALMEGFQLLTLMTDDINEAFVIFETLNARGKDLATADLLKNYLFMKSDGSVQNINQIREHWSNMTDTLERKGETTKLIRYYWNCTRKYVHDKQLYKEISHTIVTYPMCLDMVKDLEVVADLYNTLSNPFNNDFFSDVQINKHLRNLQTLKVTTFYPVVMSLALRKKSNEEVEVVLDALETMSFRNFSIAGNNPNRIEKFLADLALRLYNEKIDIPEAVEEIKSKTISNDTVRVMLMQLKPSANLAKFILREVENYIAESPEKKLDDSNSLINLEHIMPQNNSVWEYPAEEHDAVYELLGNLTLLAEKLNKSASNSLFADKKPKYEKSAIQLTKDLCKYEEWNAETIRERGEYIANKVLEIWSL